MGWLAGTCLGWAALVVMLALELGVGILALPVAVARLVWRTSTAFVAGYEAAWHRVLATKRRLRRP